MKYGQRFNEFGIPGVDTTAEPDYGHRSLVHLSDMVERGDRMKISEADRYLETNFLPPSSRRRILGSTTVAAGSLLASSYAARVGLAHDPYLTTIGQLPADVSDALNKLWDYVPVAGVEANRTGVLNHVPGALAFTGVFGGAMRVAYNVVSGELDRRLSASQEKLKTEIISGTQWWDTMTDDSIVGYLDRRDSLPVPLAGQLNSRMVVMTHQTDIPAATVVFPEDGGLDESRRAYRQAGASRTHHAVIIPGNPYDVLPDTSKPRADAIGVARGLEFIRGLDEACAGDRAPYQSPMPVTIVGNPNQPLLTVTLSKGITTNEPFDIQGGKLPSGVSMQHETLASRIAEVSRTREAPIDIIDPTALTFSAIRAQMPPKARAYMVSSPEGAQDLATSFYDMLRPPYDSSSEERPVVRIALGSDRMVAGIQPVDDIPTIYVFNDPRAAALKIQDGNIQPGDRVISIGAIVGQALEDNIAAHSRSYE